MRVRDGAADDETEAYAGDISRVVDLMKKATK